MRGPKPERCRWLGRGVTLRAIVAAASEAASAKRPGTTCPRGKE